MQIAIMSYAYASLLAAGALDTAGAIREAHALGVQAIELMDRLIDARELPAIERALADTGCRVVCYDLLVDLVTPDPAARAAALAATERGLARAAGLGADHVLLVPGRPRAGTEPARARAWLGAGLRGCVEAADRLGLTPTIENLGIEPELCGAATHILELCEAAGPGLCVTFDAGNFLLAGEDALTALATLAPRVVHVHLKDWTSAPIGREAASGAYLSPDGRGYLGAALGEGVINLSGVLAALARLGYAGAVAVEYEGVDNPRAAVARGVAFVRARLANVGAPA